VSDVDRAKRFYESLGWRLDGDFVTGEDWRAVELTPPGSQCSVIFGQRHVANLTDAPAKIGWSDAIASKLPEEEAHLGRLKAERAAATKEARPPAVPAPAVIAAYLTNLLVLLQTDPARGREILSRFVAPIVMTPEPGPVRGYRATGAFNLSCFVRSDPRLGSVLERTMSGGRATAADVQQVCDHLVRPKERHGAAVTPWRYAPTHSRSAPPSFATSSLAPRRSLIRLKKQSTSNVSPSSWRSVRQGSLR
jgi:hypothetical protein